ncbi:MAG: choice-of-anchor J domain-containing protein [Bacteroidota bacterium]
MKIKPFILITLLVLLLSAPVLAGMNAPVGSPDTIRLNFESIPDFSLSLLPWQSVDLDHHSTYGILNHTFTNDTVAKAFMCFNPSSVTPAMTDQGIQPHSGSKFGACFSATPPKNNDWLISPKVHLGNLAKFDFWVKSYTDTYGLEEYKVLISLTDSAASSFTSISGPLPLTAPVSWTLKQFDLSAYPNQDVYLAIQCVSNDKFILMVDDIEIVLSSSGALKADFSADQTHPAVGETVNFQDASTGFPTSWHWTFTGGSPSSSTAQNPGGITYSTPGNYDVTLTVDNGTSSDTKTLTGYIQVGGYPSSASLTFEGLSDFTLDCLPWTTVDVKGGPTYPINGINFPHSGQAMAYICFNPAKTTPAEQYMKPHAGSKLGCCFSSVPPSNPNDKWLISPRLTLGTNSEMDLWVMTYNSAYGLERYNIAVSTTDNNPSSFTYLQSAYETAPDAWTHRIYDLGNYNNQTVYIAIQCVSDNQFIFMLDDIHISSLSGVDDGRSGLKVSVYPNPAHEFINFNINMPLRTRIKAELADMPGKVLRSAEFISGAGSATMDIHDLNPGVYTLMVYTGGSRLIQKVVVK